MHRLTEEVTWIVRGDTVTVLTGPTRVRMADGHVQQLGSKRPGASSHVPPVSKLLFRGHSVFVLHAGRSAPVQAQLARYLRIMLQTIRDDAAGRRPRIP